jgi:hypothetical protein
MSERASSPRARRFLRAGAALGGALALFVAVGGFLHTPMGRPLLAKLSGKSCPFGRGTLDPVRREALRREGLARLAKTERVSPARVSLGFELGKAARGDVASWVASRELDCKPESQGSGLSCDDVPSGVVGKPEGRSGTLYFRFDPRERLVGVLYMVRTKDVASAVTLGEAEQATLRARFGEPTRAFGTLSVASLASGPLRQARAEYRYRDFSTFASVTNLGPASYLVTEEAQLAD